MNSANKSLFLFLVLALTMFSGGSSYAGDQHFDPLRTSELLKKGNDYAESIDMVFDVVQGGALSLGTTNGSVKVNTWSRDQIRLVITKTTRAESPYNARTILEDFLVQARHKGKNLELQGVANTESCKNEVGVTFEVWVPANYSVDINTGRGDVDIGKITGTFSARTGNGKISFECDPDGMDIEVEDKSSHKAPEEQGTGLTGEKGPESKKGKL
jgi:hypothetical protein